MPLQGNDCLRLADLKTTLSVKFTMPRKTEKKCLKFPDKKLTVVLYLKRTTKNKKKHCKVPLKCRLTF